MIWHTADQKPKPNKMILVHYSNVDFYGVYGTMSGTEIVPNCNKWCYLDELIKAAEDKEKK